MQVLPLSLCCQQGGLTVLLYRQSFGLSIKFVMNSGAIEIHDFFDFSLFGVESTSKIRSPLIVVL